MDRIIEQYISPSLCKKFATMFKSHALLKMFRNLGSRECIVGCFYKIASSIDKLKLKHKKTRLFPV